MNFQNILSSSGDICKRSAKHSAEPGNTICRIPTRGSSVCFKGLSTMLQGSSLCYKALHCVRRFYLVLQALLQCSFENISRTTQDISKVWKVLSSKLLNDVKLLKIKWRNRMRIKQEIMEQHWKPFLCCTCLVLENQQHRTVSFWQTL